MSRIGLSQTVLPNRISCLCVESSAEFVGLLSSASEGLHRQDQRCLSDASKYALTVFSPATHLLRVFFILFSALSSDPGRPSPSSHFVSFDSLRPRRKSAYLYLQDPAYAKRPRRRGKPEKRLDFRCFLPKKTHKTMTKVKLHGRVYTYSTHFSPTSARLRPGISP